MGETLRAIFLYARIILDHIIDFFFGLYWDKSKRVVRIPDLKQKHIILTESAVSLAQKIKKRELKSEELVQAVIERIKEVNPIINAVVAERYEQALSEAKEVDARIAAGISEDEWKKTPFLGVPFTSKECQAIKGMPLTMGLWARRKERAAEDSRAIVMLKDAGAIPIASTNLPELLVWQETISSVYGMTKNPHHTGRTPGGSSGAEAALTACYATPISLCSDIGGSTRMPAFFCGMFGYHPTPGTTSMQGVALRERECDSMFSLGFISRHSADLGPLMKTISISDKLSENLDRDVNIKDIKVYYTESSLDLMVSTVRPELRSAMKRAIHKLSTGATSSELAPQPYYHAGFDYMYRLWSYWMSKEPDNYADLYNNKQGEANWIVELIKKMIGQSKHCFFSVLRLTELKVIPLPEASWAEQITRDMKEDLFSKLGDNGVLLLPSAPHAAPYHRSCLLRPYNFSYFALVNVLKCPAVQIPIGKNSDGLPLGIQVLAAPYNDTLCLSVAKYLERELGGAITACKLKD